MAAGRAVGMERPRRSGLAVPALCWGREGWERAARSSIPRPPPRPGPALAPQPYGLGPKSPSGAALPGDAGGGCVTAPISPGINGSFSLEIPNSAGCGGKLYVFFPKIFPGITE